MCNKTCDKEKTCCSEVNTSICGNNSYEYLIVVVLYILLVIILAACLF